MLRKCTFIFSTNKRKVLKQLYNMFYGDYRVNTEKFHTVATSSVAPTTSIFASGKESYTFFSKTCHRIVAFRKLLSIYVFSYFPFGFEGRMYQFPIIAYFFTLDIYFFATLEFLCVDHCTEHIQ